MKGLVFFCFKGGFPCAFNDACGSEVRVAWPLTPEMMGASEAAGKNSRHSLHSLLSPTLQLMDVAVLRAQP